MPALTGMDAFTDSELFDESATHVSPPETNEAVDPLTVSSDDASPRPYREDALRRVMYAAAALAVLLVVVLAFHAGRSSREPHTPSGAVNRHRTRSRAPRRRRLVVVRHRATADRASAPVAAARAVVRVPGSGPERPTRTESVGIGRPTSASPVGNTEQFAYLGR